MTQTYRAVLFDVEDVIAHADEALTARRLAAIADGLTPEGLAAARNAPDTYPLWERYSVGAMSGEAYWSAVLAELGLPVTAANAAALREAYGAGAWAILDPAVLDLAQALHEAGYRLGLLSNSCPEHEAHAEGFAGRFDIALFSHRLGLRKPDPAAYAAAATALGVAPEAVLFVDDKRRNVLAAEAVGMTALVFEGAPALAADLARLGVLPVAAARRLT